MDYGPEISAYKDKTIGLYGGKFFPPHQGHVNMALEAAHHVDVLFVVVQWDTEYERQLIRDTGFDYIEPGLRERWLTQVFKDYQNIRVLSDYEKRTDDHLTNPELVEQYKKLQQRIGTVNKVFSGEPKYTAYFENVLPHAEHVVLSLNPKVPISATMIRENVYQHWKYLPKPVQHHYAQRIVFCGVESSGKTFMSSTIAEENGYTWLPEYGRQYYDELGGYSNLEVFHDYTNIVAGHLQALHYSEPTPLVLLDTDAIYTQFFFQEIHGTKHPVVDTVITENAENIDTYILLEPFDFDDDGTRKRIDDNERWNTFDRLKSLYESYGKEVIVVHGDGQERFEQVREILERHVP